MPGPQRSRGSSIPRDELPSEFTPETLRQLDIRTLHQLAQRRNGVLDETEQAQFDAALRDLRRNMSVLVEESLRRARGGGPGNLDPGLRRSYARTQERLAEHAAKARESLPGVLTGDRISPTDRPGTQRPDPTSPDSEEPGPQAPEATSPDPEQPTSSPPPETVPTDPAAGPAGDGTPDGTLAALEQDVEQATDTLDMLERIASLQEQQLEHQVSKLLSETRGLFFAFLVSVAVIIAGVAPLVEAEPENRRLIALWTVAITAAAGLIYAVVRATQSKK